MKKTFSLFLGLALFANTVSAQVTTVDGVGLDRDSAVRDAMRNAVEKVVGTFIDSQTLVSKSVVAMDDIYSKSQGFVRDIKVLREGSDAGSYRVTAQVDVDTNPNSQLMDRLSMIMMLNDPRIAVVVLNNKNYGEAVNDEISETAMNEKLLELGFSHIVDANLVSKLQDSQLLNSMYNGERGLVGDVSSYGIDYLVLGKSKTDAQNIQVPGRNDYYVNTLLNSGRASINVKIIKFDTGDIVGTFSVDGQGIEGSIQRASDKALRDAANKAAEKLQEKFKKLSASVSGGMQIKVSAYDYSKVQQLAEELRTIFGVQNVFIREHNGNKAILELDTTQKPHYILQTLKGRSKLGIFVEKVSNSSLELSVS